MYVGITGGNSFTFRHFLSGNYFRLFSWLFGTSVISSKILNDKIKCLHLLHCLAEADNEMFSSVKNMFQGEIIDLSNQSLSSNDVHILLVLLLRLPTKQWNVLNLSNCSLLLHVRNHEI